MDFIIVYIIFGIVGLVGGYAFIWVIEDHYEHGKKKQKK